MLYCSCPNARQPDSLSASERCLQTAQHTEILRMFAHSSPPYRVLKIRVPSYTPSCVPSTTSGSCSSSSGHVLCTTCLGIFALSPCENKRVRGCTRGFHGDRGRHHMGVRGQGAQRALLALCRTTVSITSAPSEGALGSFLRRRWPPATNGVCRFSADSCSSWLKRIVMRGTSRP